jgi:nucleotide-binding universal stress UspA family protein
MCRRRNVFQQQIIVKVILAVDGSSYSAAAAHLVATRPWPPNTIVRVLMAVESIMQPPDMWSGMVGVETLEVARKELMRQATQIVNGVAETLRATGLEVETAAREGDPRSVIVDQAQEWSADLIVVGSHGYTGLKRFLLGSVAQAVVSHAPCSVEVVRKKQTA